MHVFEIKETKNLQDVDFEGFFLRNVFGTSF